MRAYTVTFARSARKELEQLDPATGRRILSRIEALAREPRPSGCRKLVGAAELWESGSATTVSSIPSTIDYVMSICQSFDIEETRTADAAAADSGGPVLGTLNHSR